MLKPQLMTGLGGLILLGGVSLFLGYIEVASASVAGIIALGLKLLES